MTMTQPVREEAAKAAQLFETLQSHTLEFEKAQASVKRRFREIRNGALDRRRIPTADLIDQRAQKRADLTAFLDGMSQEEKSIMIIAGGNNWRAEYDNMLDPARDPKFQ